MMVNESHLKEGMNRLLGIRIAGLSLAVWVRLCRNIKERDQCNPGVRYLGIQRSQVAMQSAQARKLDYQTNLKVAWSKKDEVM